MTLDSALIVRRAYKIAEDMDMAAWVAAFTEDRGAGIGQIKRFGCYPEGSVILTQLGVIGNLGAVLEY